ncbi:MAG: hypothetical protein H7840_11020 [Alphaproteobacteria bacterium]
MKFSMLIYVLQQLSAHPTSQEASDLSRQSGALRSQVDGFIARIRVS